ncbi:capsular polysaccharide biosynthesis protein [Nemorincola caseinilytica]|uniref:protein-tyrosine-phosphatase n=1 Tax=Nemorincola caseinilytica TaxID=2054315 RepID=A0ABP8NAW8_9BACT
MSRLFGKKKKEGSEYDDMPVPEKADWSFLRADMHSHFLPGIDDGAKSPEDTAVLLKGMADMGYTHIITTPHVMIDHHPNTTHTILSALQVAQQVIKEHNINITLRAAAEYYMDDHFDRLLETEKLLPIHKNEVLVEFSMMFEPPQLANTLFNMQASGYKPIIAHPERYTFFHRTPDKYHELKDRGCLLQMNLLSLTGYYGQHVKAAAERMLADKLYDYCGSDAHHERHVAALNALARSTDHYKVANYPFRNAGLAV